MALKGNDIAPCSVDECPNEAKEGGYCWGHSRRRRRGQVVSVALQIRPKSPWERLTEAIHTYVDADDDDEFKRAQDNLRKAVAASRNDAISELTKSALAKLKAQGVKLGRPRLVEVEKVRETFEAMGSIDRTAAVLRVSIWTVRNALRAAAKKET